MEKDFPAVKCDSCKWETAFYGGWTWTPMMMWIRIADCIIIASCFTISKRKHTVILPNVTPFRDFDIVTMVPSF